MQRATLGTNRALNVLYGQIFRLSSNLVTAVEPQGTHASGLPPYSTSSSGSSCIHPVIHPVESRYKNLVSNGMIKHDPLQWEVVLQLRGLFDELVIYTQAMAHWQSNLAAFEARWARRLDELAKEDQEREAAAASASRSVSQAGVGGTEKTSLPRSPRHPASSTSWLGWLGFRGAEGAGSGAGDGSMGGVLNAEQKSKIAALEREARVSKEMGRPPSPPTGPKGLYLHGSVGSGKSMIMDLFYEAIASDLPALSRHRRMHFNAAMLEVHSRIHRMEKEEQARRQAGMESQWAAATGRQGQDSEEDVEEAEGNFSHQPAVENRGIFRYWDTGVAQQRAAKAAFLSIRKHLRQARSGKVKEADLAVANSAQLRRVAEEMLLTEKDVARTAADSAGVVSGARRVTASILCFDEMQVPDVFSAVALKALIEGLTLSGCVVILTSNRTPRELPRHGLHEVMFDNMIRTLEGACRVVNLSSAIDYRRLLLQMATPAPVLPAGADGLPSAGISGKLTVDSGSSSFDAGANTISPLGFRTFIHPLGPDASQELEQAWSTWASSPSLPMEVPVLFGRSLSVPAASNGVARFSFQDLCARTLGPADYVALATGFHTIFLLDVPVMSMQVRDQARRFITLIDELYNNRVMLVCTAAGPPDSLFGGRSMARPGSKQDDMSGSTNQQEEEPILDLEQLQFEGAIEGGRLRRDVNVDGGSTSIARTAAEVESAKDALGGGEERFSFERAVSRLHEMQSPMYLNAAVARMQRARQGEMP